MILIQDALRAIPNNSEGKYIKIIHVTAKYWSKIYNSQLLSHFGFICRLKNYAPTNVKLAGGGGGRRAWGGGLIVFVGPGVGHLTDLVLPGEGIFESFFARRRDI